MNEANFDVKTIFRDGLNIPPEMIVIYVSALNGSSSSVSLPQDVLENATDVVVGSYPTLSHLLSPPASNLSVASAIVSIQVWHKEKDAKKEEEEEEEVVEMKGLRVPVVLAVAHTRKVSCTEYVIYNYTVYIILCITV